MGSDGGIARTNSSYAGQRRLGSRTRVRRRSVIGLRRNMSAVISRLPSGLKPTLHVPSVAGLRREVWRPFQLRQRRRPEVGFESRCLEVANESLLQLGLGSRATEAR